MRYPASEKLEIINLVEQSHLPASRTLKTLGIPRTTFYRWYDRLETGARKRCRINHRHRGMSGTVFLMTFGTGLSNWPWTRPVSYTHLTLPTKA